MDANFMQNLKEIYNLTYQTLKNNSPYDETKFNEEIESWRNYHENFQKDEDFFNLMVKITFLSGFKSSTVAERLSAIEESLGDYRKVKNFNFDDVEEIINEGKVIRNVAKISSTIMNAREFEKLIKEYGSFKNYLDSFNFRKGVWNNNSEQLYKDLRERFYYLSEITTYHFLMDIGAHCIKPDTLIKQFFIKCGLIDDNDKKLNHKIVEIGREIADETNEKARVVDIVFWSMLQGEDFGIKAPICPNSCIKCELNSLCKDGNKY